MACTCSRQKAANRGRYVASVLIYLIYNPAEWEGQSLGLGWPLEPNSVRERTSVQANVGEWLPLTGIYSREHEFVEQHSKHHRGTRLAQNRRQRLESTVDARGRSQDISIERNGTDKETRNRYWNPTNFFDSLVSLC